jgi:hypothetical protein
MALRISKKNIFAFYMPLYFQKSQVLSDGDLMQAECMTLYDVTNGVA